MEGPDHDLSWHNVDAEFNDFAAAQLDEAAALVFGQKTYEMMAKFWPSKFAKEADPVVADKMNAMLKIVVSGSPGQTKWNNTRLISGNIEPEIRKLRNQSEKCLLVLGSNNLCVSLLEMHLLDELRIMISPIAIGNGTTLFKGLSEPLKLKLLESRAFNSGNVLQSYSALNESTK